MKNERGVTLVTIIVMIVIMAIIATVSIVGGVSVVKNAKDNVNKTNLADVQNAVSKEAAKVSTAGVLTPANVKHPGQRNYELSSKMYNEDGTTSTLTKAIGEDWYYLDEVALKELGIEYANEEYVVNYKLNVVIPVSTTENIHSEIENYNKK